MSEPTKQQLENAAKAAVGAADWGMTYIQSDALRRALTTAAPHLQLPWEPPTGQEIADASHCCIRAGVAVSYSHDATRAVVTKFVAIRNRALLPPPVDPRREKILNELHRYGHYTLSTGAESLAEAILAALDGEE